MQPLYDFEIRTHELQNVRREAPPATTRPGIFTSLNSMIWSENKDSYLSQEVSCCIYEVPKH